MRLHSRTASTRARSGWLFLGFFAVFAATQTNTLYGQSALSGVAGAPARSDEGARAAVDFPQSASTFYQVLETILNQHIDDSLTQEMLYRYATEGMLERVSLEYGKPSSGEKKSPSNSLLRPAEYAKFNQMLKGRMLGFGCWMDDQAVDEAILIMRVMPGGPAAKAGFRDGDRILEINGIKVANRQKGERFSLLKGNEGQVFRFLIQRGDPPEQKTLEAVRSWFEGESAYKEMFGPTIGLLVIQNFVDQTPQQVKVILEELRKERVKAVVIDLRNNSGGKLEAAQAVLDYLLAPSSPIVQLEKRKFARTSILSRGNPVLQVPIIVLTNHWTGSSAEIVANALRLHTKAQLFGETTMGKATGEEIFPLLNGYAARVTTQKILSPDGSSWQGTGLVPDRIIDDATLFPASITHSTDTRLIGDKTLSIAIEYFLRSTH